MQESVGKCADAHLPTIADQGTRRQTSWN